MLKRENPKQSEPEAINQQQQFKKLCQLCSPNFTKEEIVSSSIDWTVVWKLALRHRVVPVMADRINTLGIVAPEDIATLMAKNVQQNLYKGMRQAAELVRLTLLFEEHNIPFVAFKGIALLKLTGLELHQRHHGDIDLLLANVDDIWKADAALCSIGYQRKTLPQLQGFHLNAPQERYFKQYQKDVIYYHPERSIQLELHFKLCLSNTLLPISSEEIYKNQSTVEINSTIIPVMSQSDHQSYLLVHGATSRWFRLKWLCDVPLVSDNGQAYLSSKFSSRARTLDIERMTTLGMYLANELLSMPVASSVYQYKDSSKTIQRNIHVTRVHMAQQEYTSMGLIDQMYFRLVVNLIYLPRLKKDIFYKVDHFRSYLTRISDWEILPLPASAFFLYYPLRPFLWLKRQF